MAKTIKFIAKNPYSWKTQEKPFPAANLIPDWWRDMTPYDIGPENPDGKKVIVDNGRSNATFKKCRPMLDAITGGYIITLWADVQVRRTLTGEIRITWRVTGSDIFTPHINSASNIEPQTGYSNLVVKYGCAWIPQTPPGYSVLVTSPVGHRNLPFYAIPAVIDSDKCTLDFSPPMWVKEGFEGIVEKGTPLLQVTPFKRDNWKSEFDYLPDGEMGVINDRNFDSKIVGHYIKKQWSNKTYR